MPQFPEGAKAASRGENRLFLLRAKCESEILRKVTLRMTPAGSHSAHARYAASLRIEVHERGSLANVDAQATAIAHVGEGNLQLV